MRRAPRNITNAPASGFKDTAIVAGAMAGSGSIHHLNIIAQGTSTSERVGKRIKLKSFQIRGEVQSGSTTKFTRGSWFLVYDKRPRGVLPIITDIIDAANANAMAKDINTGRFRILKRKNYAFAGPGDGAAGLQSAKSVYAVDAYVDLKLKPTIYMADGVGTIADTEQGALYIVFVGNHSGSAGANFDGQVRLRYVDTLG